MQCAHGRTAGLGRGRGRTQREPEGSTDGQKDRQVDANSDDVKLAPTTVWILGPDREGEGPRREHHYLIS